MEGNPGNEETIKKEAPKLNALLKEMKQGLDTVRSKVQALTSKVRANEYPTAEGISYLEAKHLLLLSYCQCLVYYLLRKAKGWSIEGHPVVRSLVEMRLFLEKIRPIDKKMEYQVQKLMRSAACSAEESSLKENEAEAPQKSEDLLKYRPNPDMLVPKVDAAEDGDGLYRAPKIAPAIMDRDKMSKEERNALRREKEKIRHTKQGFIKDLIDDMEERPEEVKEVVGIESKEYDRYRAQWEKRAEQEEELFTRVPLTKLEKKREKHLKKSRNGLLGLSDNFYDDVKMMHLWDDGGEKTTGFDDDSNIIGKRKPKKQKRRH